MRKLLAISLAIAMLFAIAGCKKQEHMTPETIVHQATQSQEPTQLTDPTTPQTDNAPVQKPMYAISLLSKTEDTVDSTGKLRFQHTYQSISLILPEPAVADRIILDYLNRIDEAQQYIESVREDSLNDEYNPLGHVFIHETQYLPTRFDSSVLSLRADQTVYVGGIHPGHFGHAVTYNLLTGNTIKLSDILNSDIETTAIINLIISKLSNTVELWPDYQSIVSDTLNNSLNSQQIWYFTGESLCFRFDPYVLAPYAAGYITVEIPYAELTGILRNEFFPAETDKHQGTLSAEIFSADSLTNFNQFAELITVNSGTKILLSANGKLSDITVQVIEKDNEGVALENISILSVQSLSAKDALLIEFDPNKSKVLVTYHNGNEYQTQTVTCSENTITIS